MSQLLAVYIMLAHFVGDFVFQNSWMALGKSKSLKPLAVHILVYSATIGLMLLDWKWALVNGAMHFVTDYFTSKVNARNWAKQNYRWFWIGIGFDQFVHAACLFLTWGLLA